MKRFAKLLGSCPHLQQNVSNGQLFLYDALGFTRELTEMHHSKIKRIKEISSDVEVIAILQSNTDLGFMESYLLLDDDDTYFEEGFQDNTTGILAYVVSEICEEMGTIGIKEIMGRLVRRW